MGVRKRGEWGLKPPSPPRGDVPVLESLFNKVAELRSATLLKRDSGTGILL